MSVGWLKVHVCLALVLCGLTAEVTAQQPEEPARAAEPTPRRKPVDFLEPVHIELEDGKLRPVPGLTLEELEELLGTRRRQEAPPFAVAEVILNGEADHKTVELEATVTVQVVGEDWVAVPLRMGEAPLRTVPLESHAAAPPSGEEQSSEWTQALFGRAEDGYVWWVRGKGQHRLRMSLLVPLTVQPGGRRLELSLPDAAASQLNLTVPAPDVAAQSAQATTAVEVRSAESGRARITAVGLGRRLDLNWQPQRSAADDDAAELAVIGRVVVNVDEQTITSEATLTVNALRGRFNTFQVQLPEGTDLLPVDSPEVRTYRVETAADGRSLLSVDLNEATAGPVALKLTTRRAAPDEGTAFRVDGFAVPDAVRQSGHVALRVAGDLRPLATATRSVRRVDVADLPAALREGKVAAGFRYVAQPFELALEVHHVEPQVDVEAQYALFVDAQQATLDAVLSYSVRRVGIFDVQLSLPGGWVVDDVLELGLERRIDAAGIRIQAEEQQQHGVLHVPLVQRTLDDFQLRVRAHRAHEPDAARVRLTLPVPRDAALERSQVAVASSPNLELSLVREEMPGMEASGAARSARFPLPESLPQSQHAPVFFWVEEGQPLVVADISIRAREMEVDAQALLDLADDAAEVQQELDYQIAHEPVSQLVLSVPAVALETLAVTAEGRPLAFQAVERDVDADPIHIRVDLDEPRLGRLSLSIRYRAPLQLALDQNGAGASEIEVPLALPIGAELASSALQVAHSPALEVDSSDPQWTVLPTGPVPSPVGPREQRTIAFEAATKNVNRVRLVVRRRDVLSLPSLTVSRGWLRTILSPDGGQSHHACYLLVSREPTLAFDVPANCRLHTCLLDGEEAVVFRTGEGNNRFQVELSGDDAGNARLFYAHYTNDQNGKLGMSSRLKLPGLRLGEGAWVDRLYWEVLLPANQYLLFNRPGFTEEFTWAQTGLRWMREPSLSTAELTEWIGLRGPAAASGDGFAPGMVAMLDQRTGRTNDYLFSRVGQVGELDVWIVTSPVLVLMASGTVFLLGVLPVYFRWARNALAWFVLASTVAIGGLVYPGPAVLLGQSAALGALLVLVAGGLKRLLDRRHRTVALPVEAGSSIASTTAPLKPPPAAESGSPVSAAGAAPASPGLESEHQP